MAGDASPTALVWRLSMRWRSAVDRALAPLGLTHAQYAIVAPLLDLRAPSQRELADATGLAPLYVSKLARSLEQAGLVARTSDPVDTRAVRLALTARGKEVAVRAVGQVTALQDRLTAPLGGQDSQRTREFVESLNLLLGETS